MAATPGWQDFGIWTEEEQAAIQEHLDSEPSDPPFRYSIPFDPDDIDKAVYAEEIWANDWMDRQERNERA